MFERAGGEPVGLISFRIAAEGGYVEWRVVKQVFQLWREVGSRFGPVCGRDLAADRDIWRP